MHPNTKCTSNCYYPGDCDGSCTHTPPTVATQQPVAADAFRNMFAILHSLTPRDLAGITSSNTWPPPCLATFVLKLDDERLDALYALVQRRQPERFRV